MVNTTEIRKRMDEQNVTYEDLGKLLNKAPVSVRQKVANVRPIFLEEAEVMQNALNIPDSEFAHYFLHKPDAGEH